MEGFWTFAAGLASLSLGALVLVFTRRLGVGLEVRVVAAALLVPSMSVVIICLGAQLLSSSGSPPTLPAIAVVVACVPPCTGALAGTIERRGSTVRDARLIRSSLHIATVVTAIIAVALSLTRSAAGLGTTFLVLLIVGIGSAVNVVLSARREAWVIAAPSLSGALWSIWELISVDVVESYILPPASVGVTAGAILIMRGAQRSAPLHGSPCLCGDPHSRGAGRHRKWSGGRAAVVGIRLDARRGRTDHARDARPA